MRFLYTLVIVMPCIFGSANSVREELLEEKTLIPSSRKVPLYKEIALSNCIENTHSEISNEPKRWLLSLDGGGIRGIMQLKMLAAIEKQTGKSIVNLFDAISGTSIGGVIACVLTMPDPANPSLPKYSAQNLLDFFELNKERFFVSKWQSLGGLFRTQYKTSSLKNMLLELLENNRFSERLLPVKITCNDLQIQQARFFRSTGTEDFYTRDLAMATAAAPTYFKPQYIKPLNIESHSGYLLTDGGTFMNHPVSAGKRLMQRVYGTQPNEIRILSLGTGVLGSMSRAESLKRGGMLAWAPTIANLCIAGSASADHYDAMFVHRENYHHFSPLIGEDNSALDDVSAHNIRELLMAAQITMEQPDFARTVDIINRNCELKLLAKTSLTAA
jgi:predicted acylesterase/phospholipase RssA